MDLPEDATREAATRLAVPADADALRGVMARSFALGGPAGETEADHRAPIEGMLAQPGRVTVALEGDRVVGYTWPDGAMLEVDPPSRRRGHGRRLVAAARAMVAVRGEPRLELWVPTTGPGAAFAPAVGMRHRGSLFLLRLPAEASVPAPGHREDVTVRRVRPGADDRAVTQLALACFADHPSPMHIDEERTARAHARPGFDPASVELVFDPADPGAPIGFSRTSTHIGDEGRHDEVDLLGVLAAHRGRGIGGWLLRRAIARLRASGAGDIDLVVDAHNADALHLYTALGFGEAAEWPRWTIDATAG
ncbi:MAG: GNAT family N-acetyltransferase [Chloroflexota bacterium]